MNNLQRIVLTTFLFLSFLILFPQNSQAQWVAPACLAANPGSNSSDFPACTSIDTGELGFKIPSLGDILTFVIRAFFVIAGLAALFYMLLGAFAWVTSGGDADAVSAAQQKIQAAVVGMLIIVGVLAIIWTLEQVIFNRRICLGLSCPLTLPGILEADEDAVFCCACISETGSLVDVIDTNTMECNENGTVNTFDASSDF